MSKSVSSSSQISQITFKNNKVLRSPSNTPIQGNTPVENSPEEKKREFEIKKQPSERDTARFSNEEWKNEIPLKYQNLAS